MEQFYTALSGLTYFVKEHWDALAGSFVSFLVAQDYSLARFAAGIASGLFCAIYFSDWLLHYLPLPPEVSKADAHTIAGALWGLTGYVVVSTGLIFIQQKTTEYLDTATDKFENKGR